MKKYKELIAQNIKLYRKMSKLSQKELADRLHISSAAVSNWEKGQNSIDIDTLFEVCDILGVSINDMAGRTEKDFPITAGEKELISAFRDSDESTQDAILRILRIEDDIKKGDASATSQDMLA